METTLAKSEKASILVKIGNRFHIDPAKVSSTLKATAFKQSKDKSGHVTEVTDEQMCALLIVADQYGLNPFTREIFAFPDKGGIVPVVGIDGWSRIINEHKQFDGVSFEQDDEKCTCTIYRKDRKHPTVVTEYLSECKRGTGPWGSHPKRMLRHKALIQCARLAFGFTGIYDQDEAERISEVDITQETVIIEQPTSTDDHTEESTEDKTERSMDNLPQPIKINIADRSIPLTDRIRSCNKLDDVQSLFTEADSLPEGKNKELAIMAGKIKVAEIKRADKK